MSAFLFADAPAVKPKPKVIKLQKALKTQKKNIKIIESNLHDYGCKSEQCSITIEQLKSDLDKKAKVIENTEKQRDALLDKYNSLDEKLKFVIAQQVENNKKIDNVEKKLEDVQTQQKSPADPNLSGKQSSAN